MRTDHREPTTTRPTPTSIGAGLRELFGDDGGLESAVELRRLGMRITCAAMTLVGSRRGPSRGDTSGHLQTALTAAVLAAVADTEDFESAVDEDDIVDTVRAAVRIWVRDEVGLDTILAIVARAFDIIARALADGFTDRAAIGRAMSVLIDVRGRVIGIVAAAYVDEADHDFAPRRHSPREAFVAALLAGDADMRQAAEFGMPVTARYQVLALSIDRSFTGARHGRLAEAVGTVFGGDALALLGAAGGTVVLPVPEPGVGEPPRLAGAAEVAALTQAIGTEVTCTWVLGAADTVGELATRADELLELARAIGRPPGMYGLVDLVVEYQVTRPGPARDRLADLIRPLEANAELLETLRTHLSCGLNRRETARRLSIHPNTVDNRMSKVAATIGLDLSRPRSIAQTQSAILAFDAAGAFAIR